jgi:hypothetical protein
VVHQNHAVCLQISQRFHDLQRFGDCTWFGVRERCSTYTILLAIFGPCAFGDFLLTVIMVRNFASRQQECGIPGDDDC